MTTDQSTAIRRAAAACLMLLLPLVSGCLPFYTLTDYTPEVKTPLTVCESCGASWGTMLTTREIVKEAPEATTA